MNALPSEASESLAVHILPFHRSPGVRYFPYCQDLCVFPQSRAMCRTITLPNNLCASMHRQFHLLANCHSKFISLGTNFTAAFTVYKTSPHCQGAGKGKK